MGLSHIALSPMSLLKKRKLGWSLLLIYNWNEAIIAQIRLGLHDPCQTCFNPNWDYLYLFVLLESVRHYVVIIESRVISATNRKWRQIRLTFWFEAREALSLKQIRRPLWCTGFSKAITPEIQQTTQPVLWCAINKTDMNSVFWSFLLLINFFRRKK